MKKHFLDFGRILKNTIRAWFNDEPLRESAVIAFFGILSLPALLVLILNFAGLFLGKEKVNNELSSQIKTSINPATAKQLQEAVEKAGNMDEGIIATMLGIFIILFAATRVFVHLQKTLNHIWDVQRLKSTFKGTMKNNLFSVALILVLGFLLLLSMGLSAFLAIASDYLRGVFPEQVLYLFHLLEFVVSLSVISILFALIFKFLPDVSVSWKNVIPGAVLTALLFSLLKYALSFYFSHVNPGSVYGAAGSIVLVMLWMAIASMIVFFGAEFTKQFAVYHEIPIEPKRGARKRKPVEFEE